MAAEAPDTPGARIDRYVIVDHLGSGAMGVVLRAFDPRLNREVALKRLRPEAMGAQAEARLEREAQAMARLSHPNVVGVFDVHAGSDGLFVAMEYVRGKDLGAWLREPKKPREIIDLFLQAGRGLSAAHRAGLVHRDFKPANVLVDEDDAGRPRARVTDFGLARATTTSHSHESNETSATQHISGGQDGLDSTLTATNTVMGTPRYMAPEQHAGRPAEASADQFAYCVALWEALNQSPPFRGPRNELVRSKQSGPPSWPGTAGVPRSVGRVLARGLSPDPNARWPNMDALLRALRSASSGRRRIKLSVLGAGMLGGLVGLGAFATDRQQAAQCAAAASAVDDVWNDTTRDSTRDALLATNVAYASEAVAKAEPVLDGYAQMWKAEREQGCDALYDSTETVRDAMASCFDDRLLALESLVETFGRSKPETVRHAVSASRSLPRIERCSDPQWLAAAASPTPHIDAERLATLRAKSSRAHALQQLGLYDTGLELTESALQDAETIGWLPLTIDLRISTAKLLERTGRFADAAGAYRQSYLDAVRIGDDRLAGQAAAALTYTSGFHLADHESAELWGELTLLALDRSGETHGLAMADYLHSQSLVSHASGAYEDALDQAQRSLALRRTQIDPEDPRIAFNLEVIASVAFERGDYEEAGGRHLEALEIRRVALGDSHPDVGLSLMNLGNVAAAQAGTAEARRYYDRALDLRRRSLGADHPAVAEVLNNIAVLISDRDPEGAAKHYREALRIVEIAFGPDHPHVAMILNNLGAVADDQGDDARAIELYERAIRIRQAALGPDHASTAATQYNLALVIMRGGQADRAKALAEQALATTETALGAEHPRIASIVETLGRFRLAAGAPQEAIPFFERARQVRLASDGPTSPELAWSLAGMGEAHLALGDQRTAVELLERAIALRGNNPAEPAERGHALFVLAQALAELGQEQARALRLARSARDLVHATDVREIDTWICARSPCTTPP